MIELHLHAADTRGFAHDAKLLIVIDEVIEETASHWENADEYYDAITAIYQNEAETLCEALWRSLPGGTVDALLREMLLRRASKFRVPWIEKDNPRKENGCD